MPAFRANSQFDDLRRDWYPALRLTDVEVGTHALTRNAQSVLEMSQSHHIVGLRYLDVSYRHVLHFLEELPLVRRKRRIYSYFVDETS